jgi:hypothetical protein
MSTSTALGCFAVTYSVERAQFVVVRDDVEIIPTPELARDPHAMLRAGKLCERLNLIYAGVAHDAQSTGTRLAGVVEA